MIDGYQEITVIGVIKRFIVGWFLGGLALTVCFFVFAFRITRYVTTCNYPNQNTRT